MSSIARTAATGGTLDPDFLRWQTSLPVDRRLLAVDCEGSVAHVKGLVHAGLITAEEGSVLSDALTALPARVDAGEVELPLEEDIHMAVEAWLKSEVGDLAAKLHTGRSRNDQVATDLKLWCRQAVTRLRAGIEGVVEVVNRWSAGQGEVAMPAYTHRQVAIPTLARIWLDAALTRGLGRDLALLDLVATELAESPLGAGAIGGTTLPIDTSVTAAALGFERGPQNPVDAIGHRDHALTLVFACARISLHLARVSSDVVELTADGLCTLGGSIAGGSSMMPHKRNPDLFELVRGHAALRYGELVSLITVFQGLGSGYHRDLQLDKQVLFSAVDGTVDCLRMIGLGMGEVILEEDACRQALERGDAVATDLTEALVANGMAFRVAYRKVGALVAEQRAAGKRLVDLTADELLAAGFPAGSQGLLDVGESARRRAARF